MQRRAGTYNELYYHFVWTTKERAPIIDDEIEVAIKKVFFTKAKELGVGVLETKGSIRDQKEHHARKELNDELE